MTKSYYNRHTRDFFIGKRAHLIRDIRNRRGETIHAGEVVTIIDKFGGFEVKNAAGITIRGIAYSDIELL